MRRNRPNNSFDALRYANVSSVNPCESVAFACKIWRREQTRRHERSGVPPLWPRTDRLDRRLFRQHRRFARAGSYRAGRFEGATAVDAAGTRRADGTDRSGPRPAYRARADALVPSVVLRLLRDLHFRTRNL